MKMEEEKIIKKISKLRMEGLGRREKSIVIKSRANAVQTQAKPNKKGRQNYDKHGNGKSLKRILKPEVNW